MAAGVVGTGAADSCTESALTAALAGGGALTFNCGGTATITVTSTKTISADTIIDGGSLITISGGHTVGVFTVNAGVTFTVQNLTIANGSSVRGIGYYGSGSGGAISNSGTLIVTNATFSDNNAVTVPDGGGSGGAIDNGGTLTVTDSTFAGNGAFWGGAIANGGTLTVTDSTIAGNTAGWGGGIFNGGMLIVANSTFSGSGIYNFSCGDRRTSGYDSVPRGGPAPACPVTLTNTVVANSPAGNCTGEILVGGSIARITDGGHNLDDGTSCGFSAANGSLSNTGPLLDSAGLASNGGPTQTIALQAGSPAINAGDPAVCANPPVNGLDQRGYVRPGTGSATCSIGAYEYHSPGPPTVACGGDCHNDGAVTIDDLIMLVNVSVGSEDLSACASGDTNGDDTITIEEIIGAVNRAMQGCGELPWQAGPFGVGVRQVTFTKKSVTHPTEDRPVITDIWYPTAPDAGPEDADLGGVVDAPWAAGTTHLPLLLFSHGNCSLPTMVRFFMRAVASYGFIVAAPLHAGDLITDPNCGTDNRDGVANRVADIELIIDSLLQLNSDPSSFFSGAIDPQRIGMSGYSYGGNTALRVGTSDARVIAGFAGAAPLNSVHPASIHVPVMVQGGELDTSVPFGLESALYGGLNPPRYLVEILHTGHTMFSDDGCWSNCCGPTGACSACESDTPMPFCDAAGPDALTADAAHQLILRYAVPFLLHWVAGDNRFDAFLAPDAAPPGVIFSVDTGGSATGKSSPVR